MSSVLPLKTNEDVRAGTCSPFIWLSAVHKSSVMPSLKYSFSLSGLMLTNGNTATDLAPGTSTLTGAFEPSLTVATRRDHQLRRARRKRPQPRRVNFFAVPERQRR